MLLLFSSLSFLPYFVHSMGCAQLLSSNSIFSFLLTAHCVAPTLIDGTTFKSFSDEKMVDSLMSFSVSSSLHVYLWLHKCFMVELVLILVPSPLMVPTYCFHSWDGFRVEKYARQNCVICCKGR